MKRGDLAMYNGTKVRIFEIWIDPADPTETEYCEIDTLDGWSRTVELFELKPLQIDFEPGEWPEVWKPREYIKDVYIRSDGARVTEYLNGIMIILSGDEI